MAIPSATNPVTARLALRAGIGLACLLACTVARAQPPQPVVENQIDVVDDRPPLPISEPKRALQAAKYRIPNQDRAIFVGRPDKFGGKSGGIQDEEPLATEKQNADEYNAWAVVVAQASTFPAAELEQAGARDLTPDDLTYGSRRLFRLDLVRFDGRLTQARRIRATRGLEELGIPEIFEAWLTPAGESPGNPVCVVFTNWPEGLTPVPARAKGEDAGEKVAIDRWVSFGGYFFKLLAYPAADAEPNSPSPKWRKAPLLVGRSVTPLEGPPAEVAEINLRKDLRVFKLIRDDARMERNPEHWEENTAWNRVVLHASRFSASDLEFAARHDVTFADLFKDHRADYKLQLVSFEGRLIRLKQGETTPKLQQAGINVWYEGWLVPKDEPRGHPICLVMTELPPGLKPQPLMSKWVTFAGYSFKLMHYESGEISKADPAKNVWKKAPLLIGRSVIIKEEQNDDENNIWTQGFVPGVIGSAIGLVAIALGLAVWYRTGDRKAREEIDSRRRKNPFGDGTM